MPEVVELATFDRKYEGIAKYPAVTRDISMVMPKEILVGQVEDVIEKKGGAYLESYKLFDLYEGAQINPAVTRDISMVMPKEILVGQVEDVIEKKGGAYLESYKLFDLYEGAQIKAGFKSVAYSIVFRAKDKTLEEAERHWKKQMSQRQ